MDRKTIAILAVCFALLLLWPRLVNQIIPPAPLPPRTTNAVASLPTASISASTNSATVTPISNALAVAKTDDSAPEQLLVVTNADARYTFTSRGGGLKAIELIRFPETVSRIRIKKTATSTFATLNDSAALPIGAWLGDGQFALTQTATGVRAEKVLAGGLTVAKDFAFGTNYLVTVTTRIANTGATTVTLPAREFVIGASTPLGPQDKGMYQSVMWYDSAKAASVNVPYFSTNTSMLIFFPRTPKTEYRGGSNNVVWASAQNQFFSLIAMPQTPAAEVVVRAIDLPRDLDAITANSTANPSPRGLQTSLAYAATNLAPGQILEEKISLFAGPKEYHLLAKIADRFENNVDQVMGYSGFFGSFAKALLLAMNWLHQTILLPYGWAIIAITFVIKLVFWPLTAASTRSMKRMQKLQPQMKAIQEKYKDDPMKMNKKTMEFMKEHKISPLGGCLPMLIQIPFFFGFNLMIRSAIELRGAPFLWIGDLSQPDTLFIIPGLGLPFNPLPLIMGATQLWQARMTPPSPGMDASQQKMMRYMPLIFLFMFYNFSAGMTLYWTVQNLLTIAQTKLTKTEPEAEIIPPAKKK